IAKLLVELLRKIMQRQRSQSFAGVQNAEDAALRDVGCALEHLVEEVKRAGSRHIEPCDLGQRRQVKLSDKRQGSLFPNRPAQPGRKIWPPSQPAARLLFVLDCGKP